MFAKTLVALAAVAGANAAPISSTVTSAPVPTPTGYAIGYLEDYQVYHARYLAIGCSKHRNATYKDDYFEQCCHPLLANENITLARPSYCIPSNDTLSSASAVVATATKVASAVEEEYCDEATSIASYVNSVVATATESLTQVTYTSANYSATIPVLTSTPAATPSVTSVADVPAASASASSSVDAYSAESVAASSSSADVEPSSTSVVGNNWVAPTTTSTSEWVAPTTSEYVAPTTSETPAWVAPTTTSTYEAPATTQASSNTGGDWKSGGHATFYYQNGNPGACGWYKSDSDYIVALPYAWWANGANCGKSVTIKRDSSGATITAQVADLCPSCTSDNSLDLSVGAFTAIASESEGQVDITWTFN